MSYSTIQIWTIIIAMGIGTFAIRFSFLGLIGTRKLPPWVLRHLRYTPVAVLPGLVAPLVIWPQATNGVPDAPRILAATAAILAGVVTKSTLVAILAGAITLYGMLYLLA